MLICKKAYMKDRKIMCKVSGITCAHVRYCGLTMRWSQTDSAYTCPGRDDDGEDNPTGAEHSAEI